MAQLVERSIPTPENRRLDPDTDQKYNRKDGNLKNVPGNGSYLKKVGKIMSCGGITQRKCSRFSPSSPEFESRFWHYLNFPAIGFSSVVLSE